MSSLSKDSGALILGLGLFYLMTRKRKAINGGGIFNGVSNGGILNGVGFNGGILGVNGFGGGGGGVRGGIIETSTDETASDETSITGGYSPRVPSVAARKVYSRRHRREPEMFASYSPEESEVKTRVETRYRGGGGTRGK